jgi:hypothetical protein
MTSLPLHAQTPKLDRDPIRLLLVTNETDTGTGYGLGEAYENMLREGEIEMFEVAAPALTAARRGREASVAELLERGKDSQPNVILVQSPNGLGHDPMFVKRLLDSLDNPVVLYWEGDPWHRWRKPIDTSMGSWLAAADVVFTTARRPQQELLKRGGARDVRFIANSYSCAHFREAEDTDPLDSVETSFDVVLIGGCYAHAGLVSRRLPGAGARASLVRRLQRSRDLRLAIYGSGWSGRGAMGSVAYARQVDVIRQGLMSVNWDHFPRHESYSSDRLPISLLAGRVHVTTRHEGYDWLPGKEAGLFVEASVADVVKRVTQLAGLPEKELLELGAAGYRWVKHRLSSREVASFMLAAVDERFLSRLPAEPWHRFAQEWPKEG